MNACLAQVYWHLDLDKMPVVLHFSSVRILFSILQSSELCELPFLQWELEMLLAGAKRKKQYFSHRDHYCNLIRIATRSSSGGRWFILVFGYLLCTYLVVHSVWIRCMARLGSCQSVCGWEHLDLSLWNGKYSWKQVCSLVWQISLNLCFVIVHQIILLVFSCTCLNTLPLCFQEK